MTEQAQFQGRARSNSLQRMLELEKKLLLERTQGVTPGAKSHHSSPVISNDSLPTSPTHQRRFELSPRKENQKPAPVPTRNYSAIPPPLVINTSPQGQQSAPIPRKQVGTAAGALSDNSTAAMTPDKHALKNVAFMFPPEVEEQRSVCQSPSWEAYGRRKMEKKEEKRGRREGRKKEKEQSIKDTKPRGRRLSKAPPPGTGSAPTLGDRSMSDSVIPVRQMNPKPRPSSVLGIPIRAKKEETEKPNRGRSGSLTSVIRKSFEIRRSSFDRDSGFVGGVKLKEKREEFHQQVLEDQAKGSSRVHPALRKSFVGHGSFTPLKVPPDDKEEKKKESKRRAYPPISIQAATARNPSLLTPTSPAKPDFTNIYLWSARARGAQSDDECAVYDSEDQTDHKDQKPLPAEPSQLLREKGGLTRSGGIYVKSSPPPGHHPKFSSRSQEFRDKQRESKEQLNPNKPQKTSATRQPSESRPAESQIHIAYAQKGGRKDVAPGAKPRARGGSFSSILSAISIVPEPPRKSSKRNSLALLNRLQATSTKDDMNSPADILGSFKDPYTPPKLDLKQPADIKPVETARSPKTKGKERMVQSSPPSIPYERTSAGARPRLYTSDSWANSNAKWNFKDAAKGVFGRGGSSVSSPSSVTSQAKAEESFSAQPRIEQLRKPSVADTQSARGHSTSNSVPTIPTSAPILVPRTYSPMADSPSTWRPDTSSSEDGFYSDALHSVSPPSTPNTSPPMSEAENNAPNFPTVKKQRTYSHRHDNSDWPANDSPQLLTSARFQPGSTKPAEDSDADSIEEAARKVMEAFPNARIHLSSFDRSQIDPKARADPGFLPQLKHQPLEPGRSKPRQVSMAPEPLSIEHPDSANYLETARKIAPVVPPRGFQSPSTAPQSPLSPITPQSPMALPSRHHKSAMSVPEITTKSSRHHPTSSLNTYGPGEPIAKMFVECCACKYYHDMPSKLYEAMANPEAVLNSAENLGSFMGKVSMTVRCPWCKHEMSTKCCAGFAAMVYIKERLH
ncbi:Fc.00g021650.m01.CDS01 [Cosmosporella sp. VM-42]